MFKLYFLWYFYTWAVTWVLHKPPQINVSLLLYRCYNAAQSNLNLICIILYSESSSTISLMHWQSPEVCTWFTAVMGRQEVVGHRWVQLASKRHNVFSTLTEICCQRPRKYRQVCRSNQLFHAAQTNQFDRVSVIKFWSDSNVAR